jgi:hypothetical protein
MIIRLCILMAVAILTTILLLVVGTDSATDSISATFLQNTMSFYYNLPDFPVTGIYGALEPLAMEQNLQTKFGLQSGPSMDLDTHLYEEISASGDSSSQSCDLATLCPIMAESRLTAFSVNVNHNTSYGQAKDSSRVSQSRTRTHSTPTTTLTASATAMRTMTSSAAPRATDATQLHSDDSIMNGEPFLTEWSTHFVKSPFNSDRILSDITRGMTSVRIG